MAYWTGLPLLTGGERRHGGTIAGPESSAVAEQREGGAGAAAAGDGAFHRCGQQLRGQPARRGCYQALGQINREGATIAIGDHHAGQRTGERPAIAQGRAE